VAIAITTALAAASDNAALQVWSSFGSDPLSSLTISFASAAPCATPALNIGTAPSTLAPSPVTADPPFFFNNNQGLAYYYRARLTGLAPGTRFYYQVAACGAWSRVFSVSTLPASPNLTFILTGDMGRDDGEQILPQLLHEAELAQQGGADAASMFVIAGDFAYDLHDEEGERGASFMQRLSNVSAFIPTQMTIGNQFVHIRSPACRPLLIPSLNHARTHPLPPPQQRAGQRERLALHEHPWQGPPLKQLWPLVLAHHGSDPLGLPFLRGVPHGPL
jgi:hypothetical protein